ncbi:hypothetical protein B0H19DRAFT_1100075 [Mycena capillaripes]|nr:hypothetical protein B0H19DRAFT_1100075 [Mycena capillaripes]
MGGGEGVVHSVLGKRRLRDPVSHQLWNKWILSEVGQCIWISRQRAAKQHSVTDPVNALVSPKCKPDGSMV